MRIKLPNLDLVEWFLLVAMALIVLSAVAAVVLEVRNPCVKYGPQRVLYYQQVGTIMYPVYGADCEVRQR